MATPTDWRERAAELRELAQQTNQPERRQQLLSLAERLDEVASVTEAAWESSPISFWT